jgi:hypothetical protein
MKIKNVTFNMAVRLPNKKMESFITDQHADLFFHPEQQLLYISHKSTGSVKLVGLTNIQEMTAELEKPKKKGE